MVLLLLSLTTLKKSHIFCHIQTQEGFSYTSLLLGTITDRVAHAPCNDQVTNIHIQFYVSNMCIEFAELDTNSKIVYMTVKHIRSGLSVLLLEWHMLIHHH
jgi:hypothetical protein